ncbi:MAG: hypothetical protein K8R48_08720 [Alphaproteobacteria bacterium]|nr:hypothetical protein [Alphaproteobacteria bacterium]
MAKLWKKSNDTEGKPRLQELDLSALAISSPTIIYLSGFLTTDGQPAHIDDGIQTMEDLLQGAPGLQAKPDIYVWSHTQLRNVFNIAAYNLSPQSAYSANAEKLAKGVIMPLVSDNGKPLPFEEAQKRLRNLTLFGYSAGTVVAQEAFNAAMEMMQKIGYKPDDARRLMKEIVLISTGNMSSPSKEKNRFTTLYLAANNDFFVRWKNRIWNPLRDIFSGFARRLVIKPLSETSLLITTAIRRKMWHWRKTQDGKKTKKDISPQLPKWMLVSTHHELPHYITSDDEHNQFSKIALHALINAVNRKGTPEVLKLLEPAAAHSAEEIAAYRERIAKAIAPKKAA